jgi:hypothetical protein
MNANKLKNMTQQECLMAMESLWDAMTHEPLEPDSPDWHGEILAARSTKIAPARILTALRCWGIL